MDGDVLAAADPVSVDTMLIRFSIGFEPVAVVPERACRDGCVGVVASFPGLGSLGDRTVTASAAGTSVVTLSGNDFLPLTSLGLATELGSVDDCADSARGAARWDRRPAAPARAR